MSAGELLRVMQSKANEGQRRRNRLYLHGSRARTKSEISVEELVNASDFLPFALGCAQQRESLDTSVEAG